MVVFAVLVDLGDAVANELELEFDRISLEMLMRGLYHFSVARPRGLADDPVKYFAAPEDQDLGGGEAIAQKAAVVTRFTAVTQGLDYTSFCLTCDGCIDRYLK